MITAMKTKQIEKANMICARMVLGIRFMEAKMNLFKKKVKFKIAGPVKVLKSDVRKRPGKKLANVEKGNVLTSAAVTMNKA